MKGERVMTFDEWWKECSGWYTEDYDASGLSEWCLAKDAWYYQQERIAKLEAELAELREASAAVVMEKERLSTYIGGPVSIDGLNRLIKKLAALLLESSDE